MPDSRNHPMMPRVGPEGSEGWPGSCRSRDDGTQGAHACSPNARWSCFQVLPRRFSKGCKPLSPREWRKSPKGGNTGAWLFRSPTHWAFPQPTACSQRLFRDCPWPCGQLSLRASWKSTRMSRQSWPVHQSLGCLGDEIWVFRLGKWKT